MKISDLTVGELLDYSRSLSRSPLYICSAARDWLSEKPLDSTIEGLWDDIPEEWKLYLTSLIPTELGALTEDPSRAEAIFDRMCPNRRMPQDRLWDQPVPFYAGLAVQLDDLLEMNCEDGIWFISSTEEG